MRWRVALVFLLQACNAGSSGANTSPEPSERAAPRVETPPSQAPAVDVAPETPRVYQPSSPADYVGKHVLAAAGATLSTGPSDEAPSATLGPTPHAMEVVGHDGEFLAVRTALADNRCVDAPSSLAAFDVKLWVRPAELAEVVGVEANVRGAGQDVATLWPGAPVGTDGDRWSVDIGGQTITVLLDPALVSRAYVPAAPPTIPEGMTALDTGDAVTWNGVALDEAALLGAVRGAFPVAAVERTVTAGRRVATVWARCAELVGTVDETRPELARVEPPYESPPTLDFETWTVHAGADLWWRDGSRAGTAVDRHAFRRKPVAQDSRTCFEVPLADGARETEGAGLVLCVDASGVHYEPGYRSLASRYRAELGHGPVVIHSLSAHDSAFEGALGTGSIEALDAFVDRTGEAPIVFEELDDPFED